MIIKQKAIENDYEYLEMFNVLNEKDLHDWIHPNSIWHKKMYEKIKKYLNF